MQFIQTPDWERGIKDVTERISAELIAGQKVLWLIGGGSGIIASVTIMANLPDDLTENVTIFLTDERYGEVNHVDSNSKQLADAGFHPKNATFVHMLQPGFSMAETKERYAQALERAVEHTDVVIAQSGIGPDGHIAGILPHSAATTAGGWIVGYEAPHYTRMTMTFEAMRHIDAAYYMTFGVDRLPALTRLRDEAIPLADQPAQILKELPEAYVYNDQIGDKS
ncbi:6-phosphogluconolactonase [Aeromicrobium sp.]|nr:6-phosphogluconolactonase [Candidatus Saccharibacteria bacterium]